MMNIEKETLDVLIGVAFEQLRHGYPLAERESSALDRLPAIDVFRKSVESKDLDWLLPLVRSAPDVTAGFACSLLRHLIDEPGVAQTMMDRWALPPPTSRTGSCGDCSSVTPLALNGASISSNSCSITGRCSTSSIVLSMVRLMKLLHAPYAARTSRLSRRNGSIGCPYQASSIVQTT